MRLKAFVSAGPTAPNDNYFSDFASFSEIAITAVGPDGGNAGAGHPGPVRQQVRRQRVSRQPVRGFPERCARGDQHRRQSDRARRLRRARPRRAGREPAAALPGLQRGRGRVPEERQGVVVRRVPLHGGCAAIPLAARHGCHARRDGRDGQGHLPAVSHVRSSSATSSTKPSGSRVISPPARASPSRPAMHSSAWCFP